ncbi:LPS export ABC transporter permease LptF [Comamonas aquatilis]|uniref:LPS export ABC transporter permease LptF n=1 Tax=Comamonas aquatilis TaxID=1778406 RepID=UPI0039F0694A
MLFDSSIRKELARSFGATAVVLITVVMTMMLIRTLGQAYKGSVSPSDVMLVMGFTVLGQLPTILALSMFVAIVGSLSRMYRDSEMVIWFASGQGLASLLRPLLRFAWPVILVTTGLALGVLPWSYAQIEQIKTQFQQRSDIDRIAPGEFQESAGGNRVFFIDKDAPSAMAASNVFIVSNDPGRESVTSAKGARLEVINGERVVILMDGQRMETRASDGTVKVSEFKEYGTQIDGENPISMEEQAARSMPTMELIQRDEPIARSVLGWRLGLPLAALNFVILGLAVSSVNPRAGNSSSLMIALFAFIVYYNLMTLGESWVSSGKLSMTALLLLLHGTTFITGMFILLVRHKRWSLRDLLGRKSATGAAR